MIMSPLEQDKKATCLAASRYLERDKKPPAVAKATAGGFFIFSAFCNMSISEYYFFVSGVASFFASSSG